jgi:hypothetical protein
VFLFSQQWNDLNFCLNFNTETENFQRSVAFHFLKDCINFQHYIRSNDQWSPMTNELHWMWKETARPMSRVSPVGIAKGYERYDGDWIPGRGRDFSLLHSFQTGSGSHPPSIEWVVGTLTSGVKRPGREASHSPPSSAQVKNGISIPPLPSTSLWRGV